jgi:signal transduction histidine kinase
LCCLEALKVVGVFSLRIVLVLIAAGVTIHVLRLRTLTREIRSANPVTDEMCDLHRALVDRVARIRGYGAGMRDYLEAVSRGQEGERARLAHDLHDGPCRN